MVAGDRDDVLGDPRRRCLSVGGERPAEGACRAREDEPADARRNRREKHREALRVVVKYRWPGNVRQLAEALTWALRRRPVGCIEAEDLPAYCHSTPRCALRPVDDGPPGVKRTTTVSPTGTSRRMGGPLLHCPAS